MLLGWPKCSFGFFCNIVPKTRTNFLANPIYTGAARRLVQFFKIIELNALRQVLHFPLFISAPPAPPHTRKLFLSHLGDMPGC